MTTENAYAAACAMEDPLRAIRNFTLALDRIAGTIADGEIVQELATAIQARVQDLEETHRYFFRLHHPERERFEREGWPDEAAVEAA